MRLKYVLFKGIIAGFIGFFCTLLFGWPKGFFLGLILIWIWGWAG